MKRVCNGRIEMEERKKGVRMRSAHRAASAGRCVLGGVPVGAVWWPDPCSATQPYGAPLGDLVVR